VPLKVEAPSTELMAALVSALVFALVLALVSALVLALAPANTGVYRWSALMAALASSAPPLCLMAGWIPQPAKVGNGPGSYLVSAWPDGRLDASTGQGR
jgi:hypothetical protein